MRACLLLVVLLILSAGAGAEGTLVMPKTALAPHELALIVNDSDPLSREAAAYYRQQRSIPAQNVIHIRFPPRQNAIDPSTFQRLYETVQADTPAHVQAFALAWDRPYRVGCMSITSAFATGYDRRYCATERLTDTPCGVTGSSPYYGSASRTPQRDFKLRPTMLLAAATPAEARRLIDRGIAADGSYPDGTAYLLSTSDANRTVRDRNFATIAESLGPLVRIEVLKQDSLRDRQDVLFYFTGVTQVDHLDTLGFLPGAVADHLTSSGGHMKGPEQGGQMSSLRWLEAGATGSYGTVIEPCNFPAKFPNPAVLMAFYLRGESLIEAYWKSVAWPGEGLFIGEPLAAPFSRRHIPFAGSSVAVPLRQLRPGRYDLQASPYPVGPYRDTGRTLRVAGADGEQTVDGLERSYYRLRQSAADRMSPSVGSAAH